MPTQMTYTSLLADLRDYLERGWTADSDPVVFDQLPKLINGGERRIVRELKILGIQDVLTSTMAAGTAIYAKPDGWRETVSINYGAGTGNNTQRLLFPRSYEYIKSYAPDITVQAAPEFYADDYHERNWIFAPTPDAAYPYEVLCYRMADMLDETNETNWLTDNVPELLRYASLLESAPLLKNDERVAVWQSFYDRHASATSGEDLQRILDRAAERRRN